MDGIFDLISDVFDDALSTIAENVPHWITGWSVISSDKDKYEGNILEQFRQGARIRLRLIDGQRILIFNDCVLSLIYNAPCNLLKTHLSGTETARDCDEFFQYSIYGEVIHGEEITIPRGDHILLSAVRTG